MSYDLEVRSDDEYSQTTNREEIARFLKDQFGVREIDPRCLILESPSDRQHIEIDLELVALNATPGTRGEEYARKRPGLIDSVSVAVPYSYLATSGDRALDICFAVAARLGWQVFDPQGGVYRSVSDRDAAKATQVTSSTAFGHLQGQLNIAAHRSFFGEVVWRFVTQTRYSVGVAVVSAGLVVGYAVVGDPRSAPGFVGMILCSATVALLGKPVVEALLDRQGGR